MRKLGALVVLAILATVIMAVPAAADAPEEFVITRTMDGEIDACTGETISVDFTWHVRAHEHNNNTVIRFDGYAVTSNGGVGNGTETQVTNAKWFTTNFNFVNFNDETGNKNLVQGRLKINLETGDLVKSDVTFTCIGNN